MGLEDVRREENFCPNCSEVCKTREDVEGIGICQNHDCIVKRFFKESDGYEEVDKPLYMIPGCPRCDSDLYMDVFKKWYCKNEKCRVSVVDISRYIKIND